MYIYIHISYYIYICCNNQIIHRKVRCVHLINQILVVFLYTLFVVIYSYYMSFRHIIWYFLTFTSICRVCLPLFWILHVSWIHICTLHSWFVFLTPIHYFCMVTHACVYVFFQYAWYGVNITCGISVYPCARERERDRERERKRERTRKKKEGDTRDTTHTLQPQCLRT